MIVKAPDSFRDPYRFEDIAGIFHAHLHEMRGMDMSRVNFIEPFSMLALLVLSRMFLQERGEKIELQGLQPQVYRYLERMNFFDTGLCRYSTPASDEPPLTRKKSSSSLIEVTDIPGRERESVKAISALISLFRKRAPSILKFWMKETVVDHFVTVISELCQNIFEHSMDSGYMAVQTYTTAEGRVFRMAIADAGIGIEGSFRGAQRVSWDTVSELMEKVVKAPVSSKRPFGYGLCQVHRIIEIMKGTLYLRSGSSSVAMIYGRGDAMTFRKDELAPVPGTQVALTLTA